MGIKFYEAEKVFKLDTKNTSYVIGIVDTENFVGHVYYGKRVEDSDLQYLLRISEAPFVPSQNNRDRLSFYDSFPMEYSTHGVGDFREDSIAVETLSGHKGLQLGYVSHKIYAGKSVLQGLPSTFGDESNCETLELYCEDKVLGLEVVLVYSIFNDVDAVTRSVRVNNHGSEAIYLTKVLSSCIDMDNRDFDLITLHGSWARERHIQRRKIGYGKQGVASLRGESGHQENPFMALTTANASQEEGEVYGFNLVYSGNHHTLAEVNQHGTVRAVIGINPVDFKWKLEKECSFQAPEAVLVYSSEGIGGMSRNFHDLYRNHLIRGEYKDKKRPILINNWEATYFNFDTEKLLSIAREASSLGIEMLVMDDGWFGHRSDDNRALGDWTVNEEKIAGGLKYLVDEVNKLNMKFGIWFEPEMISPDSNLYRAHPDWAIAIPNRTAGLARNQYVLDFSRKEVIDYIYESVATVLRSANIEYVKWDMNRPLSDIGGVELPADRQGELFHRYVLGVYELQERMTKEFPHILLENCSGGGARFDPGMLYYSPQIWTSDDTDAIERLSIQEGTAMVYPLSAMGAHVSDCPNHTVGRVTPFETRGYVALAGTFGYELDVTRIPAEDRAMIPEQVEMYHRYNDLVREGDYYRLASYGENHNHDCWQVVSKDKTKALVTYIQVMAQPNTRGRILRLKGLDEQKSYRLSVNDKTYKGSTLMNAGILLEKMQGDFKGKLIYLESV
ncbi:alpha-galactosidase [Scatolibacter rhodanostii]|uniref:alpha-galactosidase n=1 Tax=Scatolibacter rhodanostii TaxID=2014781 RepID=UPI000C081F1A|nr:alpha-galactosidase [Scatolibacter rhodanostii]